MIFILHIELTFIFISTVCIYIYFVYIYIYFFLGRVPHRVQNYQVIQTTSDCSNDRRVSLGSPRLTRKFSPSNWVQGEIVSMTFESW